MRQIRALRPLESPLSGWYGFLGFESVDFLRNAHGKGTAHSTRISFAFVFCSVSPSCALVPNLPTCIPSVFFSPLNGYLLIFGDVIQNSWLTLPSWNLRLRARSSASAAGAELPNRAGGCGQPLPPGPAVHATQDGKGNVQVDQGSLEDTFCPAKVKGNHH